MIKVDSSHQFDWLTVPPEAWAKQNAQLEGTCGVCQRSVLGMIVTNARGPWEHFECAEKAYKLVHHSNKYVHSGTQRQMIDTLHSTNGDIIVNHDHSRYRHERYHWRYA